MKNIWSWLGVDIWGLNCEQMQWRSALCFIAAVHKNPGLKVKFDLWRCFSWPTKSFLKWKSWQMLLLVMPYRKQVCKYACCTSYSPPPPHTRDELGTVVQGTVRTLDQWPALYKDLLELSGLSSGYDKTDYNILPCEICEEMSIQN